MKDSNHALSETILSRSFLFYIIISNRKDFSLAIFSLISFVSHFATHKYIEPKMYYIVNRDSNNEWKPKKREEEPWEVVINFDYVSLGKGKGVREREREMGKSVSFLGWNLPSGRMRKLNSIQWKETSFLASGFLPLFTLPLSFTIIPLSFIENPSFIS